MCSIFAFDGKFTHFMMFALLLSVSSVLLFKFGLGKVMADSSEQLTCDSLSRNEHTIL